MRIPKEMSYVRARELSVFCRAVYRVVARIPVGRVLTYSTVAAKAGVPGASRAVGTALAKNCYRDVPCHRVVRSDRSVGAYAFGGTAVKIARLKHEGVRIANGRVIFPK